MSIRKWRPSHKCLYVIPEVNGNVHSLEVILNRILPLRKFVHQEDMLIFLGNYINYGIKSDQVIDALITIKKEYGDRVILLKGAHEELLLKSINGSADHYKMWLDSGGLTTLKNYLERSDIKSDPLSIPLTRLIDVIPLSHIEFLQSLLPIYYLDNYVFFHGSFNPAKSIKDNAMDTLIFDDTAAKYVKGALLNKQEIYLPDECVYVGNKNPKSKEPFIYSRYMMLGGSAPKRLYVLDLNSMTACLATNKKTRIYKYNLKIID